MAVGLLAETESQTRRAAEVEVDPRPKMEKVGVEALSQFFFKTLLTPSIEHKGEEPGSPERHSTGGVYKKRKR